MSSYPSSIYEPRVLENRSGIAFDEDKTNVLFAEDKNDTDDEVVAIETELGLNPRGIYESVAARLDDLEGRIEALES